MSLGASLEGTRRSGALAAAVRVFAVVERVGVTTACALMSVLVFLDVVQRNLSRPVGLTERLVLAVTGMEAGNPAAVSAAQWMGRAVLVLIVFALCVAAARARSGVGWGEALVRATVWTVAAVGAVVLVLVVFPSGIPGAQKLGLVGMLWMAFLGAAMAARDRRMISIDFARKLVDGKIARGTAFASGVITTGLCLALAALAWLQVRNEYRDWVDTEHLGGVMDSYPIPWWVVHLVLPLAWLAIASRSGAQALEDLRHGPPSDSGAHGVPSSEAPAGEAS